MSAYFTSVVQHLQEVSSNQQNFIINALDTRKICWTQPVAYENELLKVRPEESENQYHS